MPSASPPIHSCPSELLCDIYDMVVTIEDQNYLGVYYNDLGRLCLVCRRWKQLIDSTPLFWRFICGTMAKEILDQVLERSGSALLAVSCCCSDDDPWDELSRSGPRCCDVEQPLHFLRGAIAHCQRWESLSTTSQSSTVISEYLNLQMSTVTRLDVSSLGSGDLQPAFSPARLTGRIFGGSMPHLTYLKVEYISLPWSQMSLRRLRSFHLRILTKEDFVTIPMPTLLDIVSEALSLEELGVERLGSAPWGAEEGLPHQPTEPLMEESQRVARRRPVKRLVLDAFHQEKPAQY